MTLPIKFPIKFRGVTREGKYIYGGYYESFGIPYLVEYSDDHSCPKFVPAKGITQLVGYDKNGRELYAGDPVADQYGEGWANIRALVGHTGGAIGKVFEDYELKESADNEKFR